MTNGVESADYLATFDTNVTTTAVNFAALHTANILADLGLVCANTSGAILDFTASTTGVPTSTTVNVSGDLAATDAVFVTSSTLTITGQTGLEIFDVAFQEGLEGVATSVITNSTPGSGQGTTMAELERISLQSTSNFSVETGILGSLADKYPTNVTSTDTYTTYHILVPNDYDANINKSFKYSEIIIGLGSAVSGDLDTFLTA